MFQAERIAGTDFKANRLIEFLRPPFRRFEIVTPISPAHAARILEEIVEPPRKWGWPTSSKRGYFEGRVAASRFKIIASSITRTHSCRLSNVTSNATTLERPFL